MLVVNVAERGGDAHLLVAGCERCEEEQSGEQHNDVVGRVIHSEFALVVVSDVDVKSRIEIYQISVFEVVECLC